MRKSLFHSMSIQYKLLISYLLIVLIPLSVIGAVLYISMNQISESQTVDNRSMLMKLMSQKIEEYVHQLELFSQAVYLEEVQVLLNEQPPSDPIQYVNYKKMLFDKLEQWYSYMGIKLKIENMMIIRADGHIVSVHAVDETFPYTEMDWYKAAINQLGTPIIFGPNERPYAQVSSRDTPYTFSLVRKINNRIDNRLNKNDFGVLLIDVKGSDLANLFTDIAAENKPMTYIINEQNEIVYADDFQLIGAAFGIKPNTQGYQGWIEHQGQRFFANEYNYEKTKWRVITLDPVSEIKKHSVYIRNLNIGVGLFGILIALLISAFVAKRITKPLLVLKNTMKQVEQGDFHIQVPVTGKDEIGSLSESFNKMTEQIRDLINVVYKSQIREKEAQLKALHSQINPHFLYNTLDSISAIAVIHDVPLISNMSKMLADLFRYSISHGEKMVTLREELDQVTRYLEIQKIRYDNKFELVIDLDEGLDQYAIPKLSIQPIVENAIYHGLELRSDHGRISITARSIAEVVLIKVHDNGVGIPLDQLQRIQAALDAKSNEDHLGLVNVMERIQLHYGASYGIEITSEEGVGTTVVFKLPAPVAQ